MTSRWALCGLSLFLVAGCGGAGPAGEPTPRLQVASAAVEFGYATIAAPAHQQVVFTNPATIHRGLKLHVEGEFAAEFAVAEMQTVAPGESAGVDVAFRPGAEGLRTARLVYSAGEESGTVELAGTGVRPRLKVAERVEFGATVGPATATLTFENTAAPLGGPDAADVLFGKYDAAGDWVPLAPAVEGEDRAEFEIIWPATPRVGPGKSLSIELKFVPRSPGAKSAVLHLRTNDPEAADVRVALSGELAGDDPCVFEVAPGELSFKAVLGEVQVRDVMVRNEGAHACKVTGLPFAQGSSPAFSVQTAAPFAIGGGLAAPLRVEFRPDSLGAADATLVIESGPQRATLHALGSASVPMLVTRTELDFGVVPAACVSRDVSLWVVPAGSSRWRIDQIEVIGGPEFKLTQRPVLPASLSDRYIELRVNYAPVDAGEDVGTLRIAGVGYSVDVPLTGRGVMRALQTDVFATEARPKIDVLVVVDDSPSMADKQLAIASNLASFFRDAASHRVDYHFAVTTTSLDAAHGGAGSGPGFANGTFIPLDGSRPRVITEATPNAAQTFAQNAAVGASTACDGFLLRPIRLALSEPLLGTENAGFLRDDAHLSVILISDGADHDTAERIDALAAFLLGLKSPQRANMVSFSAIIPTLATPPAGCTYGEPDAGVSTRVKELVMRTGGAYDEICAPDWYSPGIGTNPPDTWRNVLYLSCRPDLSVTPDPISVKVGGIAFPQYGPFGDLRWSYDSGRNAIVFEALAVPEPGSTTTVTYLPACN